MNKTQALIKALKGNRVKMDDWNTEHGSEGVYLAYKETCGFYLAHLTDTSFAVMVSDLTSLGDGTENWELLPTSTLYDLGDCVILRRSGSYAKVTGIRVRPGHAVRYEIERVVGETFTVGENDIAPHDLPFHVRKYTDRGVKVGTT